jgi:hypothetical protein
MATVPSRRTRRQGGDPPADPSKPTRCDLPVVDGEKLDLLCGAPATTTRTVDGVEFDACAACATAVDAQGDAFKARRLSPEESAARGGRRHLNLGSESAVMSWLDALETAWSDADEAARDMLRPPRRRRLGPHLHRKLYRAAAKSVASLLAYAMPSPDEEPERGDPAGAGGAGGGE